MSLKLSVLITANANELKAEAVAAKGALAEVGTAAVAVGAGLDRLQAGLEESAVAAAKVETATRRATVAETDYRAAIERSVGIGQTAANSNSNRAREISDYGKALDDLRARYSPLFAVQRQYLSTLEEIRNAQKVGALSASEGMSAVQSLDRSYLAQTSALTGMKDSATGAAAGVGKIGESAGAVKLTGSQVQNLGYQLNDVATMLLMGASPFQIITSQGGQVIQALGDGPGGMRGSLAAIGTTIGSLITPTGLMATGLLAAGAAALYFATKATSVKPLEDVLKNQVAIVKELRASYGLAGEAADDYARRARGAIQNEADRKTEESTTRLREGVQDLTGQFFSGRDNSVYRDSSVYAPVREAMEALIASARKGPPDFIAFREKLSDISTANPDKAGWWQAFTKGDLARSISDAALPFVDLQRSIEATSNVAGELLRKLSAAANVRFDDANEKLRSFVPDGRSDRDRIELAFNETRGRIAQLRGMKGDDRDDLEAEAARQRGLALAEVERQESVIRDGRALDIRAINARTTAERAAIAAERERLDLSGKVMDDAKRAASIQHAADVVFAQDQRDAVDALRDRQRARGDMLSSLQIEVDSLGKTRGAAEAYRREQEMILQLYRDAEDTGRIVDPSEVQAIKDTTAAAGALTDQIARLNSVREQEEELRGLISRAGTIGGTDDDARRASARYDEERRLREANEDLDSPYGKASVRNAAKLSDFGDSIRREADAWDDWRGAGEDAIDSVVDALASGTADIGDVLKGIASDFTKTFLQLAVSNPLKNALLGTSYGTIGDLFKKTAAPSLEDAGVKAFGTVAMSAAVVNINGAPLGFGSITGGGASGAMAAINDNFGVGGSGTSSGASAGLAGNSVKAQIANYFAGKGLASHQIAGILGNVSAESGFDPLAKGDAGQAFGLFQWNDRKNNLFNSIGGKGNLGNVQSQLDFAWKELQTTENPAFKRLLASKDVRGATAAFAGFERPQGYSVKNPEGAMHFDRRLSAAEKSFKEIEGSASKMADSASTSASSFADAGKTMASSATTLTGGLGGTFESLDQEMLRISNDFTPAFGSALQSVLDAFASSLGNKGGFSGGWISALAGSITGGKTGAAGGGDAWAGLRLAGGGGVSGPGTGTSDSIPAMLSDGEFVVNAASTSKHRKLLDAINNDEVRHLSIGGPVTPFLSSGIVPYPTPAPMASGGVIINDNRSSDDPAPEISQRPDGKIEISLNRKIAEQIGKPGTPASRVLREQGKLRRAS